MQLTTNYKLKKPDESDVVNVQDFNDNADILDNVIKTHTHTKSQITDMPTSLKNPNALTLQFNGTTNKTYDGSSAQTLNITKDSIGLGNVTNESKASILANATLTGTPTAPTPTTSTNNTQIATTEFVQSVASGKANKDGSLQSNLNADMLDGKHASDFVKLGSANPNTTHIVLDNDKNEWIEFRTCRTGNIKYSSAFASGGGNSGNGQLSLELKDVTNNNTLLNRFDMNPNSVEFKQIGTTRKTLSGDLKTSEKTNIIGAINEVFQSASNGKQQIVNAITGGGGTANSNMSFNELAGIIKDLLAAGGLPHRAEGSESIDKNGLTINLNFAPKYVSLSNGSNTYGGIGPDATQAYVCKVSGWAASDSKATARVSISGNSIRISRPSSATSGTTFKWVAVG